jgi:hypothetical protein
MLSPYELAQALHEASEDAEDNIMLLTPALDSAQGRENSLIVSTFDSIKLIARTASEAERLRGEDDSSPNS